MIDELENTIFDMHQLLLLQPHLELVSRAGKTLLEATPAEMSE